MPDWAGLPELSKAVNTVFAETYSFQLPVALCFEGSDSEVLSILREVGAILFFDHRTAMRLGLGLATTSHL